MPTSTDCDQVVVTEDNDFYILEIREDPPNVLELADRGIQGPPGQTGPLPDGQLFLSSAGMWKSQWDGADGPIKWQTALYHQNFHFMDFADGPILYTECSAVMPTDWGESSGDFTLTAIFHWTADSPDPDSVFWQAQGLVYGPGDPLDMAWGYPQSVNGVNGAAPYTKRVTTPTPPIALGGTPAPGELVQFRFNRDPTQDTLAATARLLGVMIGFNR